MQGDDMLSDGLMLSWQESQVVYMSSLV